MFIDASVIVAILLQEEGYEAYVCHMDKTKGQLFCSPLVKYEATVSVARACSGVRKPTRDQVDIAENAVNALLKEVNVRDVHISTSIGEKAIEAAKTYGKTVGHEADLNFGDCFSYACAKVCRIGLIYKGNDFVKTDLA